jgi:membrane protein
VDGHSEQRGVPAVRAATATGTGTDGDAGRSLRGRSRDTLRLLRPLPEHELGRLHDTPSAPLEVPPGRQPRTGWLGRVDRFQRRHTVVGFPLAVTYKFADDQGAFLAATLAYYGFVSLFPLLLLLLSISGFVLHGDPGLQTKLLSSALRDVPVIGTELKSNLHVGGSGVGLVVGLVGTLYGALGLTQSGQTVFNRINSVPRNRRPNPIRSRLRSLRLIPILGLLMIVSSTLSAVPVRASIGSFSLGPGLHLAAILVSVAVNIGLFSLAFRMLTADYSRFREIIVGATFAGIAWQALQFGGAVYITRHLQHASEVYGVFAIVLGSITWIYVEALVVVVCAEINVVLRRRLWPRALLTPFTDDVDLTPADRRAYAGYARAERFKGYERIHVDFDGVPVDPATGTVDGVCDDED